MRNARRIIKGSVIALVMSTGLIGFAHTSAGRPMLGWMRAPMRTLGASCPLGYGANLSPEQKEAARQHFAASHSGRELASSRPALGFTLGETTKDQVKVWAKSNGITCVEKKGGPDLNCSEISAQLLPDRFRGAAVRSLWLEFGKKSELVSAIAIRKEAGPEAISDTYASITDALTQGAGRPFKITGDGSVALLASGPLMQSNAEYRFQDYYAVARAANMGDGYLLTEEYRALR